MSKLSFRARAVDASKQMPIFISEELPDLSEYASINRAVPQMPTGMEKEEEMELHLQQAIEAQQRSSTGVVAQTDTAIIPIPRVTSDVKYYEKVYPSDYRLPKQLIKVQAALNLEPEIPDYDLDSEDERWLTAQTPKMDIAPLQFERIMDALEKQSEFKVITPSEAKLLLQEDDDMLLAVYDYWLTKRYGAASQGKNLIPRVKTEKRDGAGAKHNPYVAFRRRAEKMQTRKNRRNDEESYEKILKLRHDLQKAVTLSEMVKRREKSKREVINLTLDIVDKRFNLEDFRDELFSLICNEARPSFRFSKQEMGPALVTANKKPTTSQSKKRKTAPTASKEDKGLVSREWLQQNAEEWNRPPASFLPTSPKAQIQMAESTCRLDRDFEEISRRYAFKRKRGCRYYAPSLPPTPESDSPLLWPWEQPRHQSMYWPTYLRSKFSSSTTNSNKQSGSGLRFVGLARRRFGRGGRILMDRKCWSPSDDCQCDEFPSTSSQCVIHRQNLASSVTDQSDPSYFRPLSPSLLNELDEDDCNLSPAGNVPFATVLGPNGVLRLPLTIGAVIPPNGDDQRRKSPMPPTTNCQQPAVGSSGSNSFENLRQTLNTTTLTATLATTPKERTRKRGMNTPNNPNVFAQPATPDTNLNLNLKNMKSENISSENSDGKYPTNGPVGSGGVWRKQDFGATTALLMRPPVRLPGNQNFESAPSPKYHQSAIGPGNGPKSTQLFGINASPTASPMPPSNNNNNNLALISAALKEGKDASSSSPIGNNGKLGLGVVVTKNNSHSYTAFQPTSASDLIVTATARQNSAPSPQQHSVQTLSRTMSSGALTAGESAQFMESSQGGGGNITQRHGHHGLPNGPGVVVERSPKKRAYGSRLQHPTSGGNSGKLVTSTSMVQPPSNLPVDHGSYHAFVPAPVAVVSAPSVSTVGTPTVASTAPSVSLVNGSITQENSGSNNTETSMTAQYNGQRNYRDVTAPTTTPSAISNTISELMHPLPTPSPSPNARFLVTDAGSLVAPKIEEIQIKKSPGSPGIGRLTPTIALIGKNRKSSDE